MRRSVPAPSLSAGLRRRRPAPLAAGTLTALLLAAAPAAASPTPGYPFTPKKGTQTYSCDLPFVEPVQTQVTFLVNDPRLSVGPGAPLTVETSVAFDPASIEAFAAASGAERIAATIGSDFEVAQSTPVTLPAEAGSAPATPVGEPLVASGQAKGAPFFESGAAFSARLRSLTVTLLGADGQPIGAADAAVPCVLAPDDQSTRVANFDRMDTTPPTVPAGLSYRDGSSGRGTASWLSSTDRWGVAIYELEIDGEGYASTRDFGAATAWPVPAATDVPYVLRVRAVDLSGNRSEYSEPLTVGGVTPTPTPTPTPTATPTPSPTPNGEIPSNPYDFAVAGTATLKTLTQGVLPLKGSIKSTLWTADGRFDGALALDPTSGSLKALGFLPVVAKVGVTQTEQVTGTLKSGVLNVNAKVRIKIPSVTLFGLPLAGGANCQAKNVSNINLKSIDNTFRPTSGGTIAGSFAISDLAGCGFLNGIVSPLVQGSGNAIALALTPVPVAPR